jgi:hypothetical protein
MLRRLAQRLERLGVLLICLHSLATLEAANSELAFLSRCHRSRSRDSLGREQRMTLDAMSTERHSI